MRPPTDLRRLAPGRLFARGEPAGRRRRGANRGVPCFPGGPADAELDFSVVSLRDVRLMVGEQAGRARLSGGRREDLVLAIDELASNSVVHGGGSGRLKIWRQPGAIACEVCDHGHIKDPLAGLRPPAPEQPGGRGLWVVSRLCDRVQILSSPGRTAVRVQMAAL